MHCALTPTGLQHDRQWMLVDPQGQFQTQRTLPVMALINTEQRGKELTLSRQGFGSITLTASETGNLIETRVWGDACSAYDQGDPVAQWLSRALETSKQVRLLWAGRSFARTLSKPERYDTETTYFADGAPFLITSGDSLDSLNRALLNVQEDAVSMDRFRPNIVITGLDAFEEHRIRALKHKNYTLELRYPCERCVVPTIDPQTARLNPRKQPFKLLQSLNPMPEKSAAPAFGENAILKAGNGETIRVGDQLTAEYAE